MAEEMVSLPFPEVQLLVERSARNLCLILEQNGTHDPEVKEIIKNLRSIFEALDKWRGGE